MRTRFLLVGAILIAAASWFVFLEARQVHSAMNSSDIYGFFLPNTIHVLRAIRNDGIGLFWNPYQSCGTPMIANPVVGAFYPVHLLFLVLETNLALHIVLLINMMIGGVGMYLLVRTIGVGKAAALGAAVAFEIGDPMLQLTLWSPMHNGPWAWLPWVLLGCERLLRKPPTRGAFVALVAAMTLQMLPGFLLITALTWQLVALRVAIAFIGRPAAPRPWRAAAAVATAMVTALLLYAVQLLPTLELAAASTRAGLDLADNVRYTPERLIELIAERKPPFPFLVAPLLLCGLAFAHRPNRRAALLFLSVGLFYAVLGLGATTPLYPWFSMLPPGDAVIRLPERMFWISGLALSLLAALGLDALWRGTLRDIDLQVTAALAAALALVTPGGLRAQEWAAVVAISVAAMLCRRAPRLAGCVATLGMALNLVAVPLHGPGRLLPELPPYFANAVKLVSLTPPLDLQRRFTVRVSSSEAIDQRMMLKTGTIIQRREYSDYDALLTDRFNKFSLVMTNGDLSFLGMGPKSDSEAGPRLRLADLAAIGYIVYTKRAPRQLKGKGEIEYAYRPSALPRARWVPQVEVVADPEALLQRLADGVDDLSRLALLEEPPPSGFLGGPLEARGKAHFVRDDAETVVIDVDAPTAGFLVLSDQFYRGWSAEVNERPTPILRTNYLFRAVEVPAGHSRVIWRYHPRTFQIGAAVSLGSALLLALALAISWRRDRRDSGERRPTPP